MTSLFGRKANKPSLQIGARAPALQVMNQDRAIVDLGSAYQRGPVLIYFYLRAGTPVCTAHACRFRDGFDQLQESGVQIFGVSSDPAKRLHAFKARHHLPFDLLADPKGEIAAAFHVPSFFGFPARRAFLIRDGAITWKGRAADSPAIFEHLRERPTLAR